MIGVKKDMIFLIIDYEFEKLVSGCFYIFYLNLCQDNQLFCDNFRNNSLSCLKFERNIKKILWKRNFDESNYIKKIIICEKN